MIQYVSPNEHHHHYYSQFYGLHKSIEHRSRPRNAIKNDPEPFASIDFLQSLKRSSLHLVRVGLHFSYQYGEHVNDQRYEHLKQINLDHLSNNYGFGRVCSNYQCVLCTSLAPNPIIERDWHEHWRLLSYFKTGFHY
ncbi:unnamed protein product [Parnassius mnemosyne]|uniref:Maturase K n=1 Tax=Parnassius mnemosyne TaxID=213953 RepID=A0AAV1KCP6_9NEOP